METRYPLTPAAQSALLARYFHSYDLQFAGWPERDSGKTLAADSVAYALSRASQDVRFAFMAQQTLAAAQVLQDPATGRWTAHALSADWKRSAPSADTLTATTQALQLYATAARWYPNAYRELLAKTQQHLLSLRVGNGAFAAVLPPAEAPNSAAPAPLRARDAGAAASALLALYALEGDTQWLSLAEQTLRWAMAERRLAAGGFNDTDPAEPLALDATQTLAQALFDFYLATGTPAWLSEAEHTLNQIGEHLRDLRGGFIAAPDSEFRPWRANFGVAHLASQLYHATHNMRYRALAEHALRFLVAEFDPESCPVVRQNTLLFADAVLQQPPVRIIVVGYRDDPAAQKLYQAALRLPLLQRQLEWWDRREPTPNVDPALPVLDYAAAYLCNPTCSAPLPHPEALAHAFTAPPPTPQAKPAP